MPMLSSSILSLEQVPSRKVAAFNKLHYGPCSQGRRLRSHENMGECNCFRWHFEVLLCRMNNVLRCVVMSTEDVILEKLKLKEMKMFKLI